MEVQYATMLKRIYFAALLMSCNAAVNRDYMFDEARIIGGQAVTDGQIPYQVSIQLLSESSLWHKGHQCGGALISLQHVLTAANCVTTQNGLNWTAIDPADYRVFAGSAELAASDIYDELVREIGDITVHSGFNIMTRENNIAIITLSEPFPVSSTISPLSLGTAAVAEDTSCIVSGFGSPAIGAQVSTTLQSAVVSVYNHTQCVLQYSGTTVDDTMMCAMDNVGIANTCQLDSGNPLVCSNQLSGILSRGDTCSSIISWPTVYTRVDAHADWIQQVFNSSHCTSVSMVIVLAASLLRYLIVNNIC